MYRIERMDGAMIAEYPTYDAAQAELLRRAAPGGDLDGAYRIVDAAGADLLWIDTVEERPAARRHYHVEDQTGADVAMRGSYRAAVAAGWALVRASALGGWRLTWSDPAAGYHRWQTGGACPGDPRSLTDTITVYPCTRAECAQRGQ